MVQLTDNRNDRFTKAVVSLLRYVALADVRAEKDIHYALCTRINVNRATKSILEKSR